MITPSNIGETGLSETDPTGNEVQRLERVLHSLQAENKSVLTKLSQLQMSTSKNMNSEETDQNEPSNTSNTNPSDGLNGPSCPTNGATSCKDLAAEVIRRQFGELMDEGRSLMAAHQQVTQLVQICELMTVNICCFNCASAPAEASS